MSKVAVVTAASRNIGAAVAAGFGKAGYDVVVNYKSDAAAAQAVVAQIEQAGQQALAVQADVFTEEGIRKLFDEVTERYGKIDVLVNNAGHPHEPTFGEYAYDDVMQYLAANIGTAALCSQEAAKLMDAGSILFTGSIYGTPFGGNPTLPLYSAAKSAIINLAQTLAEKLGPDIRCNVVAPGPTRTSHWDEVSEEYKQASLGMSLLKEFVEPEEIARAFVFLAETPHINAQTIVVDSGWQKKIRPQVSRHKA